MYAETYVTLFLFHQTGSLNQSQADYKMLANKKASSKGSNHPGPGSPD